MTQGLSREVKSHLLLTGKAGVGKTTTIEILFSHWLLGKAPFPGKELPVIFEMLITDISDPSNPTQIKQRIKAANDLAKVLDRRIILFFDEAHIATKMTKNALKSFLTKIAGDYSHVHLIWATTSQESRSFLDDSAFSRRWVEVHIPEFNKEKTLEAVKVSFVPRWIKRHSTSQLRFTGVSLDAMKLGYRYASLEQPHAGNPTGIRELLEGAVIFRKRQIENSGEPIETFELQPEDIRNYLRFTKDIKLLPGSPSFDADFEKLWQSFKESYVGNDVFVTSQKQKLRQHFSSLSPHKLYATILAGPPGGGKSYFTDKMAEVFFETKPLVLNGGDYSEGGLGLNKITGSPPGTVGSEQQRSVFTKYIKENPSGGVIVIR